SRLLRAGGVRAVVDVHDELAFDVVAPRHDPRAEGDEQAEQEHPDQNRHGRGEGRGEIRAEGTQRLGEDQLDAFYDSYPPRRSSRARRPSSSAIARRRILSTTSRSSVTTRLVVPAQLMRENRCVAPTDAARPCAPGGPVASQ